MTQRTCNIIRACKGSIFPEIENNIDRIKAYMSAECDYPVEDYTDEQIEQIVIDAMYDYIDTCDRPSSFLRTAANCFGTDLTLTERICIAFSLVQVKNEKGYVNGFSADLYE